MPTPKRTPLIAGNWKMNGLRNSSQEIIQLRDHLAQVPSLNCDVLICPPFTLLNTFADLVHNTPIQLGGQDCHSAASGAHTGDISAPMLKDCGAGWVIVGHSERRSDHGESSQLVLDKAKAGLKAGLNVIVCVGETEVQRDAGETLAVVGEQLTHSVPAGSTAAKLVIAYEPVWAIGTGRTPTDQEIEQVHGFIRQQLTKRIGEQGQAMRCLYGGSVKPSNAAQILPLNDVDGALIGGASLKARDLIDVINHCN